MFYIKTVKISLIKEIKEFQDSRIFPHVSILLLVFTCLLSKSPRRGIVLPQQWNFRTLKRLKHYNIQISSYYFLFSFFFFYLFTFYVYINMLEKKDFFDERTLAICGISREKIINSRGTYGCADIIRVNYVRASIQRRGFFLSCRWKEDDRACDGKAPNSSP